jgi:regulator of sirC expression with transglutaminase-like and TPR domain
MLKQRKGIPITLTALCIFIGQRIGLPIVGIGLPGRYIAKYDSLTQPIYFDPFDKGRILSADDCAKLTETMGYRFEEHYLIAATSRETLTRMMNNLIVIYNKTSESEKVNHLSDFIKVLSGNPKINPSSRPS